jgi:hypothetical protein
MTDPTLGKQMLAEIASLNATALASPTATSEPS